jgi:hypothetical protein
LSELRLSDQDRGKHERRFGWFVWPVLVLVAAAAFAVGMWTQAARDPASAMPEAPGSCATSGTPANETPKPGLSPSAATGDTSPAAAVALEATGYVVRVAFANEREGETNHD